MMAIKLMLFIYITAVDADDFVPESEQESDGPEIIACFRTDDERSAAAANSDRDDADEAVLKTRLAALKVRMSL